MTKPLYKRVLLKMSGEALMGSKDFGIDVALLDSLALQIKQVVNSGVELAIVVGGGNIFRGMAAAAGGMDRAQADNIGMLATLQNSIALQDALERAGVDTRVQSAIAMEQVAETFIRRRAIRHLEKGRVVIFAGGTGNPYFTTDTAAALRACEINANCVMKATKVDGIYDKDPAKFDDAVKYEEISYKDVIAQNLKVMDSAAIALCMDNDIPILVFNMEIDGNIAAVLEGKAQAGTVVHS